MLGMLTGNTLSFSGADQTFIELLNTEDLDNKIWCVLICIVVEERMHIGSLRDHKQQENTTWD